MNITDYSLEDGNELEDLLSRYLEAIDPVWVELEGEGVLLTQESDYLLLVKEKRAFGFGE